MRPDTDGVLEAARVIRPYLMDLLGRMPLPRLTARSQS